MILVTEAPLVIGAEKPLNAFETLTLAPIDTRLVDPTRLTAEELNWLNAYHGRVRDVLAASLDAATRAWLITATAPLGRA
jgi:Xaa-Pro aminopeptidase